MIGGFELRAFSCTLKSGDGVACTLKIKNIQNSLRKTRHSSQAKIVFICAYLFIFT